MMNEKKFNHKYIYDKVMKYTRLSVKKKHLKEFSGIFLYTNLSLN